MIAVLRRLRPRPAPTSIALPKVWCGEDGEDYWASGHEEPYRFVLAVVAQHLLDVGCEETVEIVFGSDLLLARAGYGNSLLRVSELVASVEHLWCDDRQYRCTASNPGARPVTRLGVW